MGGIEAWFVKWLGYSSVNIIYIDDGALSTGQARNFQSEAETNYAVTVARLTPVPTSGSGGASLNAANTVIARSGLQAFRFSGLRVIGMFGINAELMDFFKIADEL